MRQFSRSPWHKNGSNPRELGAKWNGRPLCANKVNILVVIIGRMATEDEKQMISEDYLSALLCVQAHPLGVGSHDPQFSPCYIRRYTVCGRRGPQISKHRYASDLQYVRLCVCLFAGRLSSPICIANRCKCVSCLPTAFPRFHLTRLSRASYTHYS